MKVVDCFIFYNELDMLEIRLKQLNAVVDYFVLVESTVTFRNNTKILYFEENKSRFAEFLPKIIHVIVSDMHLVQGSAWDRESHQRRAIGTGLRRLEQKNLLFGDDIIIVNDVDEIPDRETIENLKRSTIDGIHCLEQDFYYYNLNCKYHSKWYHPKILPFSEFCGRFARDAQSVRNHQWAEKPISRGGWHLSYFGDPKFIANKIQQFSHSEYDHPTFTDATQIQQCISDSKDLFHRPSEQFSFVPTEQNQYLPPALIADVVQYFPLVQKST